AAAFFALRSRPAPEGRTVSVGAILPLTGPAAFYGEWCRNGMNVAVAEINAAAKGRNSRLQIEFGDSKNDPREGVSLAQKLLLRDPPVIISAMTGVSFAA